MGSQTAPSTGYLATEPGRGTFTGPRSGGYVTFTLSGHDLANSEGSIFRIPCPFALRVESVSVISNITTSDPLYGVSNGVLGGTDLIAERAFPASDTVETIDATTSPALANRNMAKGDLLTVTLTADSGDALVDYSVVITAYARAHVNDDPAND